MQEEYPVQSILTYYVAELLPGVIALTRYHAMDDHDRTLAVAEDIFFDTAEDFCRLQNEVEDSLMHGFDVCVLSPHAPDRFEDINKYLMTKTTIRSTCDRIFTWVSTHSDPLTKRVRSTASN